MCQYLQKSTNCFYSTLIAVPSLRNELYVIMSNVSVLEIHVRHSASNSQTVDASAGGPISYWEHWRLWGGLRSGNISYNAPSGYHDDCVIALALANHGRWETGNCGRMLPIRGKSRLGDRRANRLRLGQRRSRCLAG